MGSGPCSSRLRSSKRSYTRRDYSTRRESARFLNGMPSKFEAAAGPGRLNAVIVTADPATGKATAIERLNLSAQEVEALASTPAPAR